MERIALVNQKGGTGKTTSALNIGAALSRLKEKVLLVDMDPQGCLTHCAGVEAHKLELTMSELLHGKAEASRATIDLGDGLSIIPARFDLSGEDVELADVAGRELRLKEALKAVRGFDYLLIDCPPSFGLLTLNALVAVHAVYIPLQTEVLALQGVRRLVDTVELLRRRFNSRLEIAGVICTRYDARRNLDKDVRKIVRKHFGARVFKTEIRENVSLAEAPNYQQDIFSYKPKSHGAEDYMALAREIRKRGKHGS